MSSQIQKVLKQALTAFTCKPELFMHNINQLSSVLEKLTAEDVQLEVRDVDGGGDGAPVSYIDIYEDSTLTMGIFVLKSNKKLPLHNHPEMHGLIKVLFGKIKVISYSLGTPKTLEVDSKYFRDESAQCDNRFRIPSKRIITAELVSTDLVDISSKPCFLEPNIKNIHEIHSVDGPAAFLDILAPPYLTKSASNGIRYCSYYNIINNVMPNIFRLQETKNPSWYWTDTLPYMGPNPAIELEMDTQTN